MGKILNLAWWEYSQVRFTVAPCVKLLSRVVIVEEPVVDNSTFRSVICSGRQEKNMMEAY